MIRSLLIITLVVFPVYIRAETIPVASGEHADFSRLVFQYPDQEDWDIGRFEGGYILDTPSDVYDYDVAKVFDLIPKTRIVKVENAPGGALKIFTNPGFHLDAFDLRAGRLVVDVKDGQAAASSKFERPKTTTLEQGVLADTPDPEKTDPLGAATVLSVTVSSQSALDERAPSIEPPFFANPMDISASRPIDNAYFSPENDPLSKQSSRILDMEDALFGQIGRAVSQGLLQADLPDKENAIAAASRLQNTLRPTIIEPVPPKLPLQPQVEDKKHVRVQTAIDRDQKKPLSLQTDMIASCPSDQLLAIETWGEPPQNGLLLSDLRSLVVGEFDQSLTEGVEKLAKYYLYLSFGAEAKAVLSGFGVYAPNSDFLRVIADIMDSGYSDSYDVLSDFSACSGASGFWATAALKDLSGTADIHGQQVASYFSGLPLHLRQHLGPKLSERFLKIGDAATAKIIQNAVSRVEGAHGDAFDLLSAEMQLSDGDITQAVDTLDSISSADGPFAAEALIRAIDIRIAQDQSIDKKTADLAEVLAIEHRDTPLEQGLKKAEILARIASGEPSAALASLALSKTQNLLSSDDQKALVNSATLNFIATFDDLAFAREALTLEETSADSYLTDNAKLQIAQRMLEIGFADLASRFANFEDDLTDKKRLILGKIAVRTGNTKDALIYLLGVKGKEAAAMRAKLYLEMDMPQKAAEEFAFADQKSAADSANFLAENWQDLSTSNDTGFTVVANHLTDETPTSAIDVNVTIATAQELLDRSQLSRSIFKDLIE